MDILDWIVFFFQESFWVYPQSLNLPGLTAMLEHDDHAMTWYDHGDS